MTNTLEKCFLGPLKTHLGKEAGWKIQEWTVVAKEIARPNLQETVAWLGPSTTQ